MLLSLISTAAPRITSFWSRDAWPLLDRQHAYLGPTCENHGGCQLHCALLRTRTTHTSRDVHQSSLDWTALHYAARYGQANVVELLLQDPRFDPNAITEVRHCHDNRWSKDQYMLRITCAGRCTDAVNYCSCTWTHSRHTATASRRSCSIRREGQRKCGTGHGLSCHDHSPSPSLLQRGMSALHCAASGGHLDTLCALMRDPRADVNSGNTLIAGGHGQACPCCAEYDDDLRGNVRRARRAIPAAGPKLYEFMARNPSTGAGGSPSDPLCGRLASRGRSPSAAGLPSR